MRLALTLLFAPPLQLNLQHVGHSSLILLSFFVEFMGEGVILSCRVDHGSLELGLIVGGAEFACKVFGGFYEASLLFLQGFAGTTAIVSSEAR